MCRVYDTIVLIHLKIKTMCTYAIWGVGLPAAEHFRETAGPGCNVCSIKLYNMTGGASENM